MGGSTSYKLAVSYHCHIKSMDLHNHLPELQLILMELYISAQVL